MLGSLGMLTAKRQKGMFLCNDLGYGILNVLITVCENLASDTALLPIEISLISGTSRIKLKNIFLC